MPSNYSNQRGQIPYLIPKRRRVFHVQWSLKLMLMALSVGGPVGWWLSWIDWLHWTELAQLGLIVGSSVLPCMLVVLVLLQLEWNPLVMTALVVGIGAIFLAIGAGREVSAILMQQEFCRDHGMADDTSPLYQAIGVSMLCGSLSVLMGVVLGLLMGGVRER